MKNKIKLYNQYTNIDRRGAYYFELVKEENKLSDRILQQ